ncbi:MAG: tetratricopeptide repeat protein [Roseibium sp.]|nr:tetratricopeptide repeat protein [Roseibium sp.]
MTDTLRTTFKRRFATWPLRLVALTGLSVLLSVQLAVSETEVGTFKAGDIHYGTPPDLPVTLSGSYLAGRLAGFQKDFASAAAFYQEALNADPDNEILLERTFLLKLANGELIEAAYYAGAMNAAGIDNFLSQLVLAGESLLKGDYDASAAALQPTAVGPLAQLSTGIARAWALYGAGKVDEALGEIDGLSGPEWFDVFKATHMAQMAFAAGQKDIALENIEAAYAADQGAIRVIDSYARILTANGRTEEAIAVLDDFDRLLQSHPFLVRTREQIVSGAPIPPLIADPAAGMSEILYGLGAAIGRDGGEELSTAYLQLALHLDPTAEFAAIALGGLYERIDQPRRAIEAYSKVPENAALKRDAEIQIGLNYNTLDDLDEAQAHLGALIEQDPTELEAIITLGNVLRSHKKFEEAEKIYSQGLATLTQIEPDNWLLFYFRGICRERLDKWESAEADFRKALELNPDQPLVLNYLGYSLVDQGLKLDEALLMIEKAVELRPNDGYIVDSLGWAYYRLGRYEEAVKELERAVELRPSDPVINDHLGDAYWKVGRRLEARFQWNHARDLDPEEDELPKILDKIANGLPDDASTDAAKAESSSNGG